MFHKDELCVNYFILVCAIVISSGFAFWLYKDTDLIKSTDLTRESGRLLLYEQYEDELKLRRKAMAEIIDDKIDIIWLPFVEHETNGYVRLEMYSRLLAGNPDYELIYRDIALTMDSAPESYQMEERIRYLNALKAIKGVHHVLLEKYDLLVNTENN